jgi:hypothetical protein
MAGRAHRLLFVDPQEMFDAATLTATSESGEHVVGNLQDQRPGRVWRSTTAATANTKIKVDFGSAKSINAFAFSHHNISLVGTVELYGSTTGAFAGEEVAITSEPQEVREPEYAYGDGPYGYGGYGGFVTDDVLPDYVPIYFLEISKTANYRYYQIRFADTTNADAYLQVGRMALGNFFQPSSDHFWGYTKAVDDISIIGRTGQGSFYSSALAKYQVVANISHNCTLKQWEDEWLPFILRKGKTRDMFMFMDESKEAEARHIMRRYYGRFQVSSLPRFDAANIGKITYGFEQAL